MTPVGRSHGSHMESRLHSTTRGWSTLPRTYTSVSKIRSKPIMNKTGRFSPVEAASHARECRAVIAEYIPGQAMVD
jgi:hypothetical protein